MEISCRRAEDIAPELSQGSYSQKERSVAVASVVERWDRADVPRGTAGLT